MTYIALLRGINVGGNNIIKMADLKQSFVGAGFENVRTYIQSGNVIFESSKGSLKNLEAKIEKVLEKDFGYIGNVVVLTAEGMQDVVATAPKKFGKEENIYKYDVVFVKKPLTAKRLYEVVPAREGVDEKYLGTHVVYFARPVAELGKSQLSKLVALPEYQNITIRNWNTTRKLLQLTT